MPSKFDETNPCLHGDILFISKSSDLKTLTSSVPSTLVNVKTP